MREIRCAVELRADDSRQSPGTLSGVLLEYETRASDRPEVFKAGALTWDEAGVVLNLQHDRTKPLLRFVPTVEGREVRISAKLPDTQNGRDAAVLVRNGTLRGLSVEFLPEDETGSGGLREIRRARLVGAGLVDDSSYSTEVQVRERKGGEHDRRRELRRLWL